MTEIIPSYSIMLIAYNAEPYITEAVTSMLQMIGAPNEIIICNDASPDRTGDILRTILGEYKPKAPVQFFDHEANLGLVENFTFAFQRCTGEVIFVCEGDDKFAAHRIEAQLAEFRNGAGINLVHADGYEIDEASDVTGYHHSRLSASAIEAATKRETAVGACMAFRRILMTQFPPMNSNVAPDRVLSMRALISGSVAHIPEPLYSYRQCASPWKTHKALPSRFPERHKNGIMTEATYRQVLTDLDHWERSHGEVPESDVLRKVLRGIVDESLCFVDALDGNILAAARRTISSSTWLACLKGIRRALRLHLIRKLN